MKITVIGCGLRTPLLIHGLLRSGLEVEELALFDSDWHRAELMAAIGAGMAAGSPMAVRALPELAEAVSGAAFVISSIRVGGIEARARDERIALEHNFAGQETTGPGGFAMALRTIPVALEHARFVKRYAPEAWLINFTNPAGLITQAISNHVFHRTIGICDTPAELFFRISLALGLPVRELAFDYVGLNHLGWVRSVFYQGVDVTDRLFATDETLRALYPAELFPAPLLRSLRLLPTEYLYFYYRQKNAVLHQRTAGATRGEEILQMNAPLLAGMAEAVAQGDVPGAIQRYVGYLNRRNASYFRLEAAGESALSIVEPDWDPFEGETGYHRIAVEVIRALSSDRPQEVVVNVPNADTFPELAATDVIETPSLLTRQGAVPRGRTSLPEVVRGLVESTKLFERLTIRAAMEQSAELAILALAANPIVADYDRAQDLVTALGAADPEGLPYLGSSQRMAIRL